jgi:hypothetical protein
VIEAYIALLARLNGGTPDGIADETFGLAEFIRGGAVQKALAASSARSVAGNAELAQRVRREQDLRKQIGAQFGLLNNVLALPPAQRDDGKVAELRRELEDLRGAHEKERQGIAEQFPDYADLIDPKPPSIEEIKTALRPDEALLAFYFGRQSSFVWVVAKDRPAAFAPVDLSRAEIEARVVKLREALEPQATMVSDIPPFDLGLAYDLYARLLKPVEAHWKPARNLIVVTNGALGLLPLSLLPTAPADVKAESGPLFSGYRKVAWLARSHALTSVPSAAALLTLRRLPPGSDARQPIIGFGDPYFNAEQAAEAARERLRASYDYYQHMSRQARYAELIPDDVVPSFALAGTPDECVAQLRELRTLGFDEVTLIPYATDDGTRADMITALVQEVIAVVRRS